MGENQQMGRGRNEKSDLLQFILPVALINHCIFSLRFCSEFYRCFPSFFETQVILKISLFCSLRVRNVATSSEVGSPQSSQRPEERKKRERERGKTSYKSVTIRMTDLK